MTSESNSRAARVTKLASLLVAASMLLVALPHEAASKRKKRHRSSVVGQLDCSACHTTQDWALSDSAGATGGFDHAKTGFPLTGDHKVTPCTGCHKAGVQVKRDCFSCHADQHQGRLGLQCDSCHNTVEFRDVKSLR